MSVRPMVQSQSMVPIVHEPDNLAWVVAERCCFCHQPTRHWTNLPERSPGQQVACCEGCAGIFEPEVVPAKMEWCECWDAVDRAAGRMRR